MSETDRTSPQPPGHEFQTGMVGSTGLTGLTGSIGLTGLRGFIPPLLAGMWLRGSGLGSQILTGDELHSVHGALEMPVSQILRTWTFGGADYCVPLTALYRFLMDQGVVLSEFSFRLPSLAAGVAAIAILPWLAAGRIGGRAAVLLAWLLALSPMLILYSRIVRSYMPAAFATGIAVLCFDRWLQQRNPAAAWAYVIAGASAVYLHLGAAPLVLSPLLFAALRGALGKTRLGNGNTDWHALLWPGLGIALAIGALMFPAHESLLELVHDKRGGELPSASSWLHVLRLQLGTSHWIVAALALALVARGAAILWSTQRDFVIFLATLIAAQVIGLLILSPDRFQERAILNRYMLVAQPLWLIPLAAGLGGRWSRRKPDADHESSSGWGKRTDWVALAVSGSALVAWFAAGPLAPGSRYWNSSFTHALTSVDFLGKGNWIPADATPHFYHAIATSDRDATLIEYPWQNLSSHAFDAYQRTHGMSVIVSSVLDRTGETRIALRNRTEPTAEAFLASGARYLVVHKDLWHEAKQVVSSDVHQRHWLRAKEELWEPLRRAAKLKARELERGWGAPSYEDRAIRVWDLDRVREDPAFGPGEGANTLDGKLE